jgi:hypothetical protein
MFLTYKNYDNQFFSIEVKQKVEAKGFCIPEDCAYGTKISALEGQVTKQAAAAVQ